MKITELLDIEYPIFQGAMAQISTADLVGAVSEAGGLGIIASGGMNVEQLRSEIRKVRAMTSKPFAVNLMLMMPGVDDLVDLIIEEDVKIVTTGAGTPKRFMPKLKAANIKVIPVIPNVNIAKKMEALGCDAVIAEGFEAGGHIGSVSTMVLVPSVAEAVSIPVIAAGGIAVGAEMAAAFALGAQGVQCGTVFLASKECPVSFAYKQQVLNANETSTVVTGTTLGHPVRAISNTLTSQYLMLEREGASQETLENETVGSLMKAVVDGDIENGTLMSGQSAGLVSEIKSVKEIIETLMHDAKRIVSNLVIG